jgi:outer membrane protein
LKALLLLGIALAQGAPAPLELTIEKSVEIALRNAVAVLKSENNTRLAGAQLLQAYGQFLPNLVTSGSYAYRSGTTLYTFTGLSHIDQNARLGLYSISSTLNLFNGLADYAGLKGSLERKKAADLSLERAREAVAFDVAVTFIQVVLDQQVTEIAEKNLAASQGREKLFRGQNRVGAVSLADLYRQLAQTQSDQSFLIASRARARDDELLLVRKLQLDPGQPYKVIQPKLDATPNPRSLKSEQQLVDEAMKNRSDYLASRATHDAADWDISVARAGYLPRLDFTATFGGLGTVLSKQVVDGIDKMPLPQESLISQLGDQTQYTLGLYLSWNLFDRFVTKLNVERADVAASNAEIDYNDLRLQVSQEVRQSHGDYRAAAEQLTAANEGAKAAQKAYDVVAGRYTVRASSFIDLLTAQATLLTSQIAASQAALNYMLQGQQLNYVLGTLPLCETCRRPSSE